MLKECKEEGFPESLCGKRASLPQFCAAGQTSQIASDAKAIGSFVLSSHVWEKFGSCCEWH